MTVDVPDYLDWDLWRICKHFHVPNPNIVLFEWSLDQYLDALDVIDLEEELEAKVRAATPRP